MDIEILLSYLNKRKIAAATGISYSRIYNLSCGKVYPREEEIEKIKNVIKRLA